VRPLRAHEHWHIAIAYLNLGGTFYYLCSILVGASRAIVHWDIRDAMTEADVEVILERAREKFPSEAFAGSASFDSGHAPMLSQPEVVATTLLVLRELASRSRQGRRRSHRWPSSSQAFRYSSSALSSSRATPKPLA
jgi:hypothetical protein